MPGVIYNARSSIQSSELYKKPGVLTKLGVLCKTGGFYTMPGVLYNARRVLYKPVVLYNSRRFLLYGVDILGTHRLGFRKKKFFTEQSL